MLYSRTLVGSNFQDRCYPNWTKLRCFHSRCCSGGYDAFRSQYPEHCTNGVPFVHRFMGPTIDDDESAFLNFEATQITPNIFIGGLHDASSDLLLNKLGITHIVNCSRTPYKRDPKFKYLSLECADDLKQSLAEKLKPAFEMIGKSWSDYRISFHQSTANGLQFHLVSNFNVDALSYLNMCVVPCPDPRVDECHVNRAQDCLPTCVVGSPAGMRMAPLRFHWLDKLHVLHIGSMLIITAIFWRIWFLNLVVF